jgi:hypothetical protein
VNEEQFKERTRDVALRAIRLTEAIPKSRSAEVLGVNSCDQQHPSALIIAQLVAADPQQI